MDATKEPPLDVAFSDATFIKNIDQFRSVDSGDSSCSDNEPNSKILEEVVNVVDCWGVHDFERHPWSDRKRPRVYIKRYEDLKLDENEKAGILSTRMIGTCLSYLERSPILLHYAYTKCVLSGKGLVDIISLKAYNFIQCLDLSGNKLKGLEALSQLPFLQYLDASNNIIENLLDFKAPYYLNHVNYNGNLISELPDLSQFWSITYLEVAYNNISNIRGLENLRFITYLNLSHNKITRLENLNDLRITTLILNDNLIETFENDLHTLSYLETVDLSNNKLNTLRIFQHNEQLEKLLLTDNVVSNMLEIYYINQLRYLHHLNLLGNPITHLPYYRKACLNVLNRLKVLDNEDIRAVKRVKAQFKDDIDHTIKARENRMELLLLQHINDPKIGTHIFPYDQPPPEVIMIVGPVGSRKKELALEFVKANRKSVLGINHTTRPRHANETHDAHYYFINNNEFRTMVRNGEFIAVSEYYGNFFGISYKELEKGQDAVIVFCSDITSALTLKVMGINPKIVLAMPKTEETHSQWLKKMYFHEYLDQQAMNIKKTQESVKAVAAVDEDVNFNEQLTDISEFGEESSTDETNNTVEGILHICKKKEFIDEERHHYFEPEDIENDDKRLSSDTDYKQVKLHMGILKNQSSMLREEVKCPTISFGNVSSSLLQNELKKELGIKKVSFNWFPSMDWFDVDFVLGPKQKNQTHLTGEQDNQVSLLNTHDDSSNTKETMYTSLNQQFEKIQSNNLNELVEKVVKTRNDLLELHWTNPGLFREVIFTDDRKETLAKLKDLLKFTVEHHKDAKPLFSFEDDPVFESILKSKIDSFNLNDNI